MIAAILGPLLAACMNTATLTPSSRTTTETGLPTTPKPSFAQFTDIPIPGQATMDVERTLILGSSSGWTGRLVMRTPEMSSTMYDFYLEEMPKFGWQLLTVVRTAQSLQTYRMGDRFATVQIKATAMGGASINLTVSPQGAAPSP
ncbi:MAG: hypothetical protein J4G10_03600 [Alphaproteobacteria bacterium]|nr:hypothetical protein [Alphaproteobacteria bacterium]